MPPRLKSRSFSAPHPDPSTHTSFQEAASPRMGCTAQGWEMAVPRSAADISAFERIWAK